MQYEQKLLQLKIWSCSNSDSKDRLLGEVSINLADCVMQQEHAETARVTVCDDVINMSAGAPSWLKFTIR